MLSRRTGTEAAAAAWLGLTVLALFAPIWLRGLTPFWGDLTYLHLPWQQSTTQMLEAGRLPLWDPFLYFGMPMAANMQRAVFYPGMAAFRLFGFATAVAVFQSLHLWLGGWLLWLCLRRLGLGRAPALAGATLFLLGGGLVSHLSFLNHLAVLSLLPALLLFSREPALLALALAAGFLAGYPPFLVGGALLAVALWLVLASPGTSWIRLAASGSRTWLAASLLAAGLVACQCLPGIELLRLSRRNSGLGPAETLLLGYSWKDLPLWVSPVLRRGFEPALEWTRSSYLGFVGTLAAFWGLWGLGHRRAAGLGALLGLVLFLTLGQSTAASRMVWECFWPLRFVRYPGNLAFLAWPVAALLAAAGCQRLRASWRLPLLLALAGELLLTAFGRVPLAPRALFTSPGPLASWLGPRLDAQRYLLSPLALESVSGRGVQDWKWRLYGLTNDPYRLRAGGNFGEPLVPRSSYGFLDLLYGQPSAEAAARLLPGVGIGWLLTRDALPATPLLRREVDVLWHIYRLTSPTAVAWQLDPAAGSVLPAGLPEGPLPASSRPLREVWPREDRFELSGDAGGWAFVAEPRYPGWRIWLEAGQSRRAVETLAAWSAFQKTPVPEGPWRLRFLYDPLSWKAGLLLSVAFLAAFGLYWYNSVLRWSTVSTGRP